jgi:hypothetical protein
VPLADPLSITVTQQGFENDAQGHRQASDIAYVGGRQGRQGIEECLRLTWRRQACEGVER